LFFDQLLYPGFREIEPINHGIVAFSHNNMPAGTRIFEDQFCEGFWHEGRANADLVLITKLECPGRVRSFFGPPCSFGNRLFRTRWQFPELDSDVTLNRWSAFVKRKPILFQAAKFEVYLRLCDAIL
jgi:hypothetical protein